MHTSTCGNAFHSRTKLKYTSGISSFLFGRYLARSSGRCLAYSIINIRPAGAAMHTEWCTKVRVGPSRVLPGPSGNKEQPR